MSNEFTFAQTLEKYIKNEWDLVVNNDHYSRIGRSVGVTSGISIINDLPDGPIPEHLIGGLEGIFEYAKTEYEREILLTEHTRLRTLLKNTLKLVPGKSISYETRTGSVLNPVSVTVILWYDKEGNDLFRGEVRNQS